MMVQRAYQNLTLLVNYKNKQRILGFKGYKMKMKIVLGRKKRITLKNNKTSLQSTNKHSKLKWIQRLKLKDKKID